MEPSILGLVIDSSPLIAAERRNITAVEALNSIRRSVGNVDMVICSLSVAELGHAIYRANTQERRAERRKFVDEIKTHIPVMPITAATAEIIARIGGEQAARGITIPLGDLIIGACALELGYAVGTGNVRDFSRIPGLIVVHL